MRIGKGKPCVQDHSPGSQGSSPCDSPTHTHCPFPCSGPGLLDTYCHQAGVHVLPETGSRGDLGLPLLTYDSWIRTERHRVGSWALLENLLENGPSWEKPPTDPNRAASGLRIPGFRRQEETKMGRLFLGMGTHEQTMPIIP